MKYAREVQDLLGPYPGREFRMVHIVRHVARGRDLTLKERRAMRKAVARVLESLAVAGVLVLRPPEAERGGPIWYAWKSETRT